MSFKKLSTQLREAAADYRSWFIVLDQSGDEPKTEYKVTGWTTLFSTLNDAADVVGYGADEEKYAIFEALPTSDIYPHSKAIELGATGEPHEDRAEPGESEYTSGSPMAMVKGKSYNVVKTYKYDTEKKMFINENSTEH